MRGGVISFVCFARLIPVLLTLLLSATVSADTSGRGMKPDLRLLIDTSSSMENSDPDNLRAPALEMIVRLLPDGARAGVWSFGETVQVLVPHEEVDTQWRSQAHAAIAEIDNSGQLTNIPAAIRAASYDSANMDSGYRASIVLLTDGKVEVAESPMVNASAARTLLATEAVELGASGIPVHTIALSDEADWVFLRSLAQVTGGIAEQAETAGQLGTIFLQSLEMVAPMERVPLTGNLFTIDLSVEEFTALVFHEADSRRMELVSPDGQKFKPAGENSAVDWFRSEQFTLVTFSDPDPGEWQLSTAGDFTARVSVISEMGLGIDPPANSVPAGGQAELGLWVTNQGAPITDAEVLAAFELLVDVTRPDGVSTRINVSKRYPAPADGEYRVTIPPFEQPGRYQIMVRLDGLTMQRELPLHIEVAAPSDQPTLVTRGFEETGRAFRVPLAIIATVLAAALLLTWVILRRRKRRKLEIWERRSRHLETGAFSREQLKGASTKDSESGAA